MATAPLLELKNVGCCKDNGQVIFSDVSLTVDEGEVLVLQGRSGSGKSTLLKCISHLSLYTGEIFYRGQYVVFENHAPTCQLPPQFYGIPKFRSKVLYVPQRASLLPGTPRDFLAAIYTFATHSKSSMSSNASSALSSIFGGKSGQPDVSRHGALDLAEAWGIDRELWDRTWANLSGGEAQRIALAIAVGLDTAEVLLLDEPTSALDADTSSRVEGCLVSKVKTRNSNLKALVWITHSEEQGQRVGTRFARVTAHGIREESLDPGV